MYQLTVVMSSELCVVLLLHTESVIACRRMPDHFERIWTSLAPIQHGSRGVEVQSLTVVTSVRSATCFDSHATYRWSVIG
jgi:hypothetical protein